MTVHDTDRSPNSSACDGFIIVAVLWILVALATLASIYSIYINNSALAVSGMDDGLQAEALVSAGLELTAFRLTVPKDKDSDKDKDKDKEAQRPTRGQFAFRLGRANVTVNYSSETARIDLNAAPKVLLAGSFVVAIVMAAVVRRMMTRIATPIGSSAGVNVRSRWIRLVRRHFTALPGSRISRAGRHSHMRANYGSCKAYRPNWSDALCRL